MEEKQKSTQSEIADDIVVQALKNRMQEDGKVDFQERNIKPSSEAIIKTANNKFLLEVLSPEIKENEIKKRKHKDWLMYGMGAFLLLQFLLVACIIIGSGWWIIKSHVEGNPFADSTIQLIFTFIGAYITSVVVELIAILKYIVKNVFDTSIAGMVNNFKDDKNV